MNPRQLILARYPRRNSVIEFKIGHAELNDFRFKTLQFVTSTLQKQGRIRLPLGKV